MMVRGRRSARGDRGAGHRRTPHPHATRIPLWKGLGADSEEKHEPVSDSDTVVVDSLKALDPEWPIREADKRADASLSPLSAGADTPVAARPTERLWKTVTWPPRIASLRGFQRGHRQRR